MFHDSVARHYWSPHFNPEFNQPIMLESRLPFTSWNFAPFSHIGGRWVQLSCGYSVSYHRQNACMMDGEASSYPCLPS